MSARSAQYAPCHIVAQKGDVGDRTTFYGSDAAPSLQAFGSGLQDHRLPWNMYGGPAGSAGFGVLGWYGSEPICLSLAPSAAVAGNIAAAANVVNGTAMTLANASTGITVLSGAASLLMWPGMPVNGQAAITSGLVIEGNPAPLSFGRRFIQGFYDRSKMLARAVSITGVAGGTGGNFTVRGYDVYGYPMSETIAMTAGATTKNGKKAFKVVTSVTPAFTDAHNYSVQTTDIIGLPILVNRFEDMYVFFNGNAVTATAGFTAADTTNPATATTGDPRGTYTLQSASDGVKFLSVQITPSLSAMQAAYPANLTSGIFGVTPA